MRRRYSVCIGLIIMSLSCRAEQTQPLDEFLRKGQIKEGLAAYSKPGDNANRFSLATLQALDGLQQFVVGFNKLGINPDIAQSGLPFLRAIVPDRQQGTKDVATTEKVAGLFINLKKSLQLANKTLAGIDEKEFSVKLNVSQARIDWNGDGKVAENEMLLAAMGRPMGLNRGGQEEAGIVICFDSADAVWLKGYTHLLTGMLDVFTAYDWTPVWNQCAHILFSNPDPVPPIARHSAAVDRRNNQRIQIIDLIASLHEMRLEIAHKDALKKARDEFMNMIACSRICWKRALAETDDNHEWLPSPAQTGPGGTKISQDEIEAWHLVLNELEAVLTGKKLLPHWRIKPTEGINVDKLVAAPPRLDIVLLVQGSALIPYLQEGPVSDRRTWMGLMQPFGSGFVRFAIWSN